MIFISNDQEVFMRCAGCNKVQPVHVLAIGKEIQAEHVIPICDSCRAELAVQAALPIQKKTTTGEKVIRVAFGQRKVGTK